MGRIGDPVTQAAVLFHIRLRDASWPPPGSAAHSGVVSVPTRRLGAAGQVGSPASDAATVILNLDLDALDGVADGLNPFLHVLAVDDFPQSPEPSYQRPLPPPFLGPLFVRSWKASGVRLSNRPIRWPPLDVDVFRSVTCSSTGVSRT